MKQRQTDRQRHTENEIQRDRPTEAHTESKTERPTEAHRETNKQTQIKYRHTEKEKQTDRQTRPLLHMLLDDAVARTPGLILPGRRVRGGWERLSPQIHRPRDGVLARNEVRELPGHLRDGA